MFELTITSLLVVLGIYLWVIKNHGYWKKRGVLFPKPYALVGNMGHMVTMRKSFKQILVDIYRDFQGCAYVGIFNMRTPALLLRDVELIKEVLIKEFSKFHDVPIDIDEDLDPILAKSPSFLKGDRWKVIRSQITPLLTVAKIKAMLPLVHQNCQNLINYITNQEAISTTDGLEAKELAMKFTTDNVASCAFGLDANSFTDPNAEFRKWSQGFFKFTLLGVIKFFLNFVFPEIGNLIKVRIGNPEVASKFRKIIIDNIKYRQETGLVRNDFLDAVIEYKSKPLPFAYTTNHIVAHAMTFFINGSETSATTISFALFELASNLDIQNKLSNEIDQILAKHNGSLTFEGLQEMTYVDALFLETLRKYPPGMLIRRKCTQEFELPCLKNSVHKAKLDKGTQVLIPILAVHRDSRYYPDPESFNPDRFLDEAYSSSKKYFLGFGDGPRICLGQRFATMQIKAALIALISKFEVQLNIKTQTPLELDTSSAILSTKGGIWLNLHRKNGKKTSNKVM